MKLSEIACSWALETLLSSHNITQLDAIHIHANVVYECILWECWMAMSFCLFNYCLTVEQEVIRCKLNHLFALIKTLNNLCDVSN